MASLSMCLLLRRVGEQRECTISGEAQRWKAFCSCSLVWHCSIGSNEEGWSGAIGRGSWTRLRVWCPAYMYQPHAYMKSPLYSLLWGSLRLAPTSRPCKTFKPTPESSSFQRPQSDMNVASGCPQFTKLSTLDDDNYVKDDVMYIKCIVDTSRIFHPWKGNRVTIGDTTHLPSYCTLLYSCINFINHILWFCSTVYLYCYVCIYISFYEDNESWIATFYTSLLGWKRIEKRIIIVMQISDLSRGEGGTMTRTVYRRTWLDRFG